MRRIAAALFALAALLPAQERKEPWAKEVVDRFTRLPIQDDGRLKPLGTYAKFQLLQFRSLASCPTPAGERLTPAEWLLDVLFFPEQAKTYLLFTVDDSAILDAIGLGHEGKKKRDRYSYLELKPARARLLQLASEKNRIDAKQRTRLEQQFVNLANNVLGFEKLAGALAFAREPLPNGETYSAALEKLPARMDALRAATDETERQKRDDELDALSEVSARADVLTVLPPAQRGHRTWFSPGGLAFAIAAGDHDHAAEVALVARLERLTLAAGDRAAFARELETFAGAVDSALAARGEGGALGLEVTFYAVAPFFWATMLFVLGFLVCAFGWLFPASRALRKLAPVLVGGGLAFLVAGIAMRCLIRMLPPVTGLYDTIIFITAAVVLVALVIEWINRRGIALVLAAVLGAAGTWFSMRYEAFEMRDTMPTLQAVLMTNFWLWTHVTCITIGYAAGLLAGALGHVYLFGRLLRWQRGNAGFYALLARMIYGVLAFGLCFSVFGTIWGGIWANDSWGRFWGWDPKENGALLICLVEIAILHARMGGYLRQHGLAMASVLNTIVIAFSWWHVNQLGVGLHSYGFTDGVLFWLTAFYGLELVVLALGGVAWLRDRRAPEPDRGAAAVPAS